MIEITKILEVTSSFQRGGTEAFIMNVLRSIDRDKFKIDFYWLTETNSPYKKEIDQLGGRIFHGSGIGIKKVLFFVFELARFLRRENYNVVHSHINIANSWVMLAACIARVRVRISHSHSHSHSHDNPIEGADLPRKLWYRTQRLIIRHCANKYFACSNDAGVYLYGKKLYANRGLLIRNGIDFKCFFKKNVRVISKLRETYGLSASHFIIGNISRFEPNKNSEFVVDLFNEYQKVSHDAVLVMGGVDGGQLNYIKARVCTYGIKDKVRFIGERDDVAHWLKVFDLFLFPSHFEGLGIVLLEAQASGLPCLVSTGIPIEADMGLGLMDFVSLDENIASWIKHIDAFRHKCFTDEKKIKSRFEENGYDIKTTVKLLEAQYGKGVFR